VNEVMKNMQETIAKESPRRGIVRRVLVGVMALAALLTLGACKATGGGQIDDPVPSRVLPTIGGIPDVKGSFTGEANFGFNFTCEMTAKNKAVIKGEITYHDTGTSTILVPSGVPGVPPVETDFPEIRIHGVVDPMYFNVATCELAAQAFFDAAQFDGNYRSQDTSLTSDEETGRFTVLVFDQAEPGVSRDPAFVTGDGFAIDLKTGPYVSYTRAGYIEGGNIQVDNT
jgi:hypothetical protein